MSCGLCRWAEICEVCHMLSACSPGFVPRTELRMICVAQSRVLKSVEGLGSSPAWRVIYWGRQH